MLRGRHFASTQEPRSGGNRPARLAHGLPIVYSMPTNLVETEGPFIRRRTRGALTRLTVISRAALVVDYLFGILYGLLAVRFILEVLQARRDTGFVSFIRDVTNVFYAPFSGIVPTNTVDGVRVVWSLVVAMVAYLLLHAIIRGLLRLLARA